MEDQIRPYLTAPMAISIMVKSTAIPVATSSIITENIFSPVSLSAIWKFLSMYIITEYLQLPVKGRKVIVTTLSAFAKCGPSRENCAGVN